ncbi:alpha/beta fold hydrolase [Erwinia phyllosphaerae]|uniref:alpha/beta fold hydrolase n=1 Tax=Erwinia phyllosphaerae TaxID=2853256 RepID=UPI001FEF0A46|nr:alpha/beta hydrolase [Erwinia phyllosphaerae]MBV4365207.1 alpha/beta hydrolase [Erwinia phyllosphaerae]
MPYTSGTPRLFYRTQGKGPLIIMLHGLLMSGQCWENNGLISAFSPYFRVICPDMVGHGASEKPDKQEWYTRQSQALAIVRLMDELGYDKAHLIGYSAGAWLAIELIRCYPDRLHSVILGGWDCLKGLPETPVGKLTFDIFMSFAREVASELTSPLSPDDEQSAARFFNELGKPAQETENLFNVKVPVLFWAGRDDPYYAAMHELAEKHAIQLISGKGDHLREVNHPDDATISKMLKFVREQEPSSVQ